MKSTRLCVQRKMVSSGLENRLDEQSRHELHGTIINIAGSANLELLAFPGG